MELQPLKINLLMAWLWVLAGFTTGAVLGLKFHREDWLGGYASYKRRMFRLGHISFFGLAMINLMFYFVAQAFAPARPGVTIASWGFLIGALTMPLACLLMAQSVRWRNFFVIPVGSLLTGATLTLWEILHL